MRNITIAVALLASVLFAAPAFATGNGNGNGNNGNGNNHTNTDYAGGVGAIAGQGYIGTAQGTFEVGTNGGSMAQTGIYNSGAAFQYSGNTGSAYAGGGADFSQAGYVGHTFGGSESSAVSFGWTTNPSITGYENSTAGGVGSNYEANVTGTWQAAEFGAIVGFAGFTFNSW